MRWATGTERLDTIALEWWRPGFKSEGDGLNRALVRVRVDDPRVMTGAVWVPAEDVRRRVSTDTDRPSVDLSDPHGSRG